MLGIEQKDKFSTGSLIENKRSNLNLSINQNISFILKIKKAIGIN